MSLKITLTGFKNSFGLQKRRVLLSFFYMIFRLMMTALTLGLFIMVTTTDLVTGMIMMVPIMLIMMVAVMLIMVSVPLMIFSMMLMSNSGMIIMAFPVVKIKLISHGGSVMSALIVHVKTASLMVRFSVLVTKETSNETRSR